MVSKVTSDVKFYAFTMAELRLLLLQVHTIRSLVTSVSGQHIDPILQGQTSYWTS